MSLNRDEVSATGPGGFGVGLKAQNALILVIMAAALAWMLWTLHDDRRHNRATFDAAVARYDAAMTALRAEHTELLVACKGAR